ncbi:MAG: hypothetical protein K6E83_12470 [Clostridium sp.]|nr:hypothetical protein [Clostridium sp.]
MDYRKLSLIIIAAGILFMLTWGFFENDWAHSWISVLISVCCAAVIFFHGRNEEKK